MLERSQVQIQTAIEMMRTISPSVEKFDLVTADVYPRLKGRCLRLVVGQDRQKQLAMQLQDLRVRLSSEGIEMSRRQLVRSYVHTDVAPEITKSADEYFGQAMIEREHMVYPVDNILAFCSIAFMHQGLNFAMIRLSVAEAMFNPGTNQVGFRQLEAAVQDLEQHEDLSANRVLSDAVIGLGLLKGDPTGVTLLKEVVKDASGKPSRYPAQLPYSLELQRSIARGTSLALEIYRKVFPLTR